MRVGTAHRSVQAAGQAGGAVRISRIRTVTDGVKKAQKAGQTEPGEIAATVIAELRRRGWLLIYNGDES